MSLASSIDQSIGIYDSNPPSLTESVDMVRRQTDKRVQSQGDGLLIDPIKRLERRATLA